MRWRNRVWSVLLCCFFLSFPVCSMESTTKSVVFLVDLSGSMAVNDEQQEVLEGISQMISMLPSFYQVGVVAYSDEIVLKIPLTSLESLEKRSYFTDSLTSLSYQGYSNAGLGLSEAVALLNGQEGEKHLVFICDGEILLPSQSGTTASELLFQEGISQGIFLEISLHLFALGDWGTGVEQSELLSQSKHMNGNIHFVEVSFQKMFYSVVSDSFNMKPILLKEEVVGTLSKIDVDLPFTMVEKGSLFLQSREDILSYSLQQVDISGELSEITSDFFQVGNQFAVISLEDFWNVSPEHGENTSFEIELELAEESEISLYFLSEIRVVPKIKVTYEDVLSEDGLFYHRTAFGEISFYSPSGQALFQEDFFQGLEFFVTVNDLPQSVILQNGMVILPFSDLNDKELGFFFEDFPVIVDCTPLLKVQFQSAPQVPPKAEEAINPLYFIFGGFLLGLLLGTVFYQSKKKNRNSAELSGKNRNHSVTKKKNGQKKSPKYSYVGQLELELTEGKVDYPVSKYALFRVPQHRPVTLEEVIELCYEIPCKLGTNQIVFSPWKDKFVALTNDSNATLLYKHEILRKNQRHPIPVGGKLDILLEDGSELVIIYNLP